MWMYVMHPHALLPTPTHNTTHTHPYSHPYPYVNETEFLWFLYYEVTV